MKVVAVTTDYFEQVRSLFSGHEVSHLKMGDYMAASKVTADLVVFSGGADINPEFYGVNRPKNGWFHAERDEWEMEILRFMRKGHLKFKKVLGICRGMQLLNVGFGGSLVYDIPTDFEGYSHPGIHALEWVVSDSPLASIFPEVNSLHHQGLRGIGESYPCRILAREPRTKIPEVSIWANQFLGVQFHPEFMTRNPNIKSFVTLMEEWVADKVSLYPSVQMPSRATVKKLRISPQDFYTESGESNF